MKTIKFDCNGNNSPAYSCNKPGDNSGEYVEKDKALRLEIALRTMIYAFDMGPLDIHQEYALELAKNALLD